MRHVLSLLGVLALVALPAMAAQPKKERPADWPSKGEIAKAARKAEFNSDNTAQHEYNRGVVKFVPAKIGDMNDEERAKGLIIGRLNYDGAKSPDGLPKGRYDVFASKYKGNWHIFYCQEDDIVGEASIVMDKQDNQHEPEFMKSGSEIHYWELRFSW